MTEQFAQALKLSDLADNTIASYCKSVEYFYRQYGALNKKNLLTYKGWLVENYKAKTVNLRLQAMNRYLDFLKKPNLKMKFIKVQQKNFLENVISDADYRFFCRKLKAEKRLNWYFVVRYLCATGARISELLQIKVEHVEAGYLDLHGKGGGQVAPHLHSEATRRRVAEMALRDRNDERLPFLQSLREAYYAARRWISAEDTGQGVRNRHEGSLSAFLSTSLRQELSLEVQ